MIRKKFLIFLLLIEKYIEPLNIVSAFICVNLRLINQGVAL